MPGTAIARVYTVPAGEDTPKVTFNLNNIDTIEQFRNGACSVRTYSGITYHFTREQGEHLMNAWQAFTGQMTQPAGGAYTS